MSKRNRPDLEAGAAYAEANKDDPRIKINRLLADNPALAEVWEHAREWARTQPEVQDAQAAVDMALAAIKAAAGAERNELSKRHLPTDIETMEGLKHLARVVEMVGPFDDWKGVTMANVYDYALAWADRQTSLVKLERDVKTDAAAVETPPPPPKWDKATEARNKWLYKQCCAVVPYSKIENQLNKKPLTWVRLTTNGIKNAAKAYAERYKLDPIPARQNGRPKKK